MSGISANGRRLAALIPEKSFVGRLHVDAISGTLPANRKQLAKVADEDYIASDITLAQEQLLAIVGIAYTSRGRCF
jgi:hypothetical protein